MQYAEIKTGTRLEVSFFHADITRRESAGLVPVLVSQLLEPARGNELVIAVPIQDFRFVAWPDECLMRVDFCQLGSCLWTFTACLADRTETDGIQAFRIRALEGLQRRQRREWYRLPINLDMTFWLRQALIEGKENAADTAGGKKAHEAVTRDISGGGTAFITADAIPGDCEVELVLRLDDRHPVRACGRIVRVGEPEPGLGRRQISLQFTEISQPHQEALVQFVFQQQLKKRRQ